MKAWWQQLNIREQRLVAAMSVLVLIFIIYSAIWQPINDNLASANKKTPPPAGIINLGNR